MPQSTIYITNKQPSFLQNLKSVYHYRQLLFMMSFRMMFSRYHETLLGWGWLLLRNILPAILSTFVFNKVMGVKTGPVPYILFFLTGNTIWNFFTAGTRIATRSIRVQRPLIKTSTFPTVILPIAYQTASFVELGIGIMFVIATIIYYWITTKTLHVNLSPTLFFAPLFLIGPLVAGLAFSLFTSILSYVAKDIRMLVPQIFQAYILITPIAYPLEQVPAKYAWIAHLNPLTFFIEAFRAFSIGYGIVNIPGLILSSIILILLLLLGFKFFFNTYRTILQMN